MAADTSSKPPIFDDTPLDYQDWYEAGQWVVTPTGMVGRIVHCSSLLPTYRDQYLKIEILVPEGERYYGPTKEYHRASMCKRPQHPEQVLGDEYFE